MRIHLVILVPLVLICAGAILAQTSAGPTIGDPADVRLDLAPGEIVALAPVEGVELLEQRPDGVLVRAFRTGEIPLSFLVTGEDGATRTIDHTITISSVLHADDDLEPAPLSPPVLPEPNRVAWYSIGVAAIAAIALWLQLLRAPRESRSASRPSLSASEEFLRTIERVRQMSPSDERFATLSDATRRFLERVDPRLGRELTSSELLDQLRGRFPDWLIEDVRDVLSEGDYAKFSPWGGRAIRFESILKEANDLAVLDREGKRA